MSSSVHQQSMVDCFVSGLLHLAMYSHSDIHTQHASYVTLARCQPISQHQQLLWTCTVLGHGVHLSDLVWGCLLHQPTCPECMPTDDRMYDSMGKLAAD